MPEPASSGAARFKPDAQPHERGAARPEQRGKTHGCLIVLIVLLLFAGVGVVFWWHRPVSVMVNGAPRTVFRLSTVGQLFDDERPRVKPGNLVSVAGSVLSEGKGYPFTCSVDGTRYEYQDAYDLVLHGEEDVTFMDGTDKLEGYTTEVTDLAPKLELSVAEDTPEKGYMVQQGTVQYVKQWGKPGTHEVRHGEQSGETGDGKVIDPAQNCIIGVQNIHPDNDEKLVALTFDDGPSYYTESYLKILAENDVKATFCIIGEQVADGRQVIAQTANAGHLIASHTWDHKQLTALDDKEVRREVGDTAQALADVVGSPVTFLRPPYGDLDGEVWVKSGGVATTSVYWTHDSLDWETPGVDAIVNNATQYMVPGSVILMHDGGGDRSQDVEALPRIIAAWKEAGYRFVTIRELMESDSSIDLSAVDMGSMPADAVWPNELA